MLPEAAGEYRGMVRQLRDARELLTDVEYAETRACVFEMLGGRVVVRPRADGSAVLTLNLDSSLIFKSYKSTRYNLVAGAGFGICLLRVSRAALPHNSAAATALAAWRGRKSPA